MKISLFILPLVTYKSYHFILMMNIKLLTLLLIPLSCWAPPFYPTSVDGQNDRLLLAEKLSKDLLLSELPNARFENTSKLSRDGHHGHQQAPCQLVQVIHLLRHARCQPKAITSFACNGLCPSYVQVSIDNLNADLHL